MKEHPILFSTEMVKAILDGRKTMTRRVVKPQFKVLHAIYTDKSLETERIFRRGDQRIHCPYGQVGDRLWVRETFRFFKGADVRENYIGTPMEGCLDSPPHYKYKADGDPKNDRKWFKWRPSIFMPRHASRITLEITNIKVERLQEICLVDIQAEGIYDDRRTHNAPIQIGKFKKLWDSINAMRGYPFDSNPWVWVISFKVIN